jgi:hypothetical protein
MSPIDVKDMDLALVAGDFSIYQVKGTKSCDGSFAFWKDIVIPCVLDTEISYMAGKFPFKSITIGHDPKILHKQENIAEEMTRDGWVVTLVDLRELRDDVGNNLSGKFIIESKDRKRYFTPADNGFKDLHDIEDNLDEDRG